jgi:TetR/AcrR family transcriptional regulator
MSQNPAVKPISRIQRQKRDLILAAALDCFSACGYHGATIDTIAARAGLSKSHLLYYFPTKEKIHQTLIEQLLDTWLEPLRALDADGEPVSEILAYVERKLEMSRDLPRESRLFANEVLRGGAHVGRTLRGHLRDLVDEKAAVIRGWAREGRIADVDPYHLIFSIWAATQHYADFDVQVRAILAPLDADRFERAREFLTTLYRRGLTPPDG